MTSIKIRNEGEMEKGIELMIKLIRSKKKNKELNIYTHSKEFAELFLYNAHREIELLKIKAKSDEPELALNIYIGKEDDEDKEKDHT
jgi:hypothetical protein